MCSNPNHNAPTRGAQQGKGTMTRRDYVLIANVLCTTKPDQTIGYSADALAIARGAWREIARSFAATLASENPRFDRARFLKACGVSE